MRKTIISALIGAGIAFSPPAADAVGLGKMTVLSSLGQPFRGEIELLAVDKLEEGALSAGLASPDAFKNAKIDRPATLAMLRFSVEQNKSGGWFVKLTSPQPVNDPFLDMLIEINWPSGRLFREYTVLLDPPGISVEQPLEALAGKELPVEPPKPVDPPKAQALPAAASPQRQALPPDAPKAQAAPVEASKPQGTPGDASKAAEPVLRTEKALVAKRELPPTAKPESPPPKEDKPKTYGPVKPGQTLSKIATAVKPGTVSLEQMLVSLYHANRQAFDGNMNRLKTGRILHIPENDKVMAQDQAAALKEVRAHAADWNSYQKKLAGAVEAAKPAHEDEARQSAGGKITPAKKDDAKGAKEPPKDVLKLSKSEQSGAKPSKNAVAEDAIAHEKALQEARTRIAELEKTIKDMQRLLEIRSQGAPEPKTAAEPKAPVKPPAPAAVSAPAPVSAVAADEQPKPKPKPKVVTLQSKPVEPAAPSFMGMLFDNPLLLGGGALVALLGGLFGARAVRRKLEERKAEKEAAGATAGRASQPGAPAGVQPEASSALTDFTQSGLSGIDTNEVDPIAEAEVYMAYGRDTQAEEILREAMVRDPQRHEIQLKLLEIYAARKDRGSFEALARQFYAATGGYPNSDWKKAAEMGRTLDAGNPLYSAVEASPALAQPESGSLDLGEALGAVDTSPDLDFNLGAMGESPGEMDMALGAQAEAPVEDLSPSLDFDLGFEAAAPAKEAAAPENLLDFNLGAPDPAPEPIPVAEIVEDEEHILNFDLDFPTPSLGAEAKKTEELSDASDRQEGMISAESWNAVAAGLEEPASQKEEPEIGNLDIPGLDMPSLEIPSLEIPSLEIPSLEMPSGTAPQPNMPAPEAPSDESLTFDLSSFLEEEPAASAPPAAKPAPTPPPEPVAESILISPPAMSDEAILDFDFDIGEETPPPSAPNIDLSGIDLEVSPKAPVEEKKNKVSQEDNARFQDVATKMDLAKAYIEMGDKEGASEILQEVLKEGSDEQQADAKKLLEGIR